MYPLKFIPIIQEKIWGGNRLEEIFHKDPSGLQNIGESWELSGHPTYPSVAMNGFLAGKTLTELVQIYKEKLVGEVVYERFKEDFPLLFKFIDANDDLSIQVHPNDQVALERHKSLGKTEMWYVLHAEPDAKLTIGFKHTTNKSEYLKALESGKIDTLLKKVPVKSGDVFFIPAGTVHAIGKGVMVAEIQESSDITYRIYDYDRIDTDGNKRQLHTNEALDVIDFSVADQSMVTYEPIMNQSVNLVNCEYFKTNLFTLDKSKEMVNPSGASFIVYMCLSGGAEIFGGASSAILNQAETIMIPASLKSYKIIPLKETKLLEVTIRE